MDIEEKHNPNSHERLNPRDTPKSWSELPLDLLISVFKRLSFANFQRAKTMWAQKPDPLAGSLPGRQQQRQPSVHNKRSWSGICKEFLHRDLQKLLLMRNRMHNLYIVNLFTHERIDLPPVEAQHGVTKMERTLDDDHDVFCITSHNGKEYKGIQTREYVVLWELRQLCVVYSRKGDTSWNQIPEETSSCCDLVYMDSKLYFLSLFGQFRIFDFSGEFPQQTFQCGVIVERFRLGLQLRQRSNFWSIVATKLVVTVTGEVLKVEKLWKSRSETWSFRKHDRIYSLGDESMLLDQGITVLANDTDGFIKNSVYFSVSGKDVHDIFLFNLETQKTELLHKFDSSSVQFPRARWFLPSIGQT
ncbi:hypothetical protein Bca101_018609 [Brassica carinata]